jgi:hypothetical protein
VTSLTAWLCFLGPIALSFIVGAVWRVQHPGSFAMPGAARARGLTFMLIGAGVGLYCLARLPSQIDASTRYYADPSCAVVSRPAAAPPGGDCAVESAGLVATFYVGGRSGTHYYLTPALADGSRPRVEIVMNRTGMQLWHRARDFPGVAANVQLFRGRVVAFANDDGVVRSRYTPQANVLDMQVWGMLGAGLFAGGLLQLLLSWESLF